MANQTKKAPRKNLRKPSLRDVNENVSMVTVQSTAPAQVDHSPDGMIAVALSGGRSMEDIGTLIKFRNEEIARLAKLSFIGAKKEFTKLRKRIVKTNVADFGQTSSGRQGAKYKYEDLDIIDETIKDCASECGFSWDWKTEYRESFIYITCILSHIGGHQETDTMRGAPDTSGGKNSIQADGSTTSYLMRYTLKKVLGLSTGKDDDDGKGAAKAQVQAVVLNREKPSEGMYKILVDSVMKKTVTLAELQKTYLFTDEQLETLSIQ